jgi:prepilin peptidase CpaA
VILPALSILIVIAYIDWKQRRIPNSWLMVLSGWAACYAAFSPAISLQIIAINAIIGLALTLPGFMKGVVGGGDVKLMLAISPLWPPIQLLWVFSTGILGLLLLMSSAHLISTMSLTKVHCPASNLIATSLQRGLPLGSAIAMGAIFISLFNFIS